MYLRYFGFDSYPFAVTPDPAFLYLSESHREALAHLLYGAGEHGGFVALTGEVGTGKTTLIRAVVDNDTSDLDIALCWNPHLGTTEFLGTICDELGVDYDPERDTTLKALVDRLNAHLLQAHAANRRTVLIIDEAQNLSRDVLEQLRLLTNLETHKEKLLRVILVGQPELGDLLMRHDLRQLAQRITARFTLRPLGLAETRAYVQHRLERANGPQHLFSRPAMFMLRALTRGVPRLINMVCERALMGAYAHGRSHIGPWTVARAAAETLPARPRMGRPGRRWRLLVPTGAVAASVLGAGLIWLPEIPPTNAAEDTSDRGTETAPTGHSASEQNQSPTTSADAQTARDAEDAAAPQSAAGKASDKASDEADAENTAKDAGKDAGQPDSPKGQQTRTQAAQPDKAKPESEASNKTQAKASRDRSSAPKPQRSPQDLPVGDADINQLLRLWGVFGAQVRAGCGELHVGDLRCLADHGDLKVLERYNRPALLMLDRDGQSQTVLLSAVNDKTVTLVGSQGTRDVARSRLLKSWTGRFEVVWRSDSGVRLIQPGSVGNAVVWLRKRLLQIDGQNPHSQLGKLSPVYDNALGERLRAFQKSHGLEADGLAGPRTQMMLNGAVLSPGSPSLRSDAQTSEK
ncbi:AAA family ATPase [Salinisphaera sp. SPP-AMP-43]|uniref:AAA family ATPase n=1 Tax=Salinisphaera sp. SPP-AMP-43 TaxID=3121288 RepID=UPI003C6E1ACB